MLDDAVAAQDTLTQLIAAIRRVRRQEEADSAAVDAVGLLALVAGQDVELVDPDPDGPDGDAPSGRGSLAG